MQYRVCFHSRELHHANEPELVRRRYKRPKHITLFSLRRELLPPTFSHVYVDGHVHAHFENSSFKHGREERLSIHSLTRDNNIRPRKLPRSVSCRRDFRIPSYGTRDLNDILTQREKLVGGKSREWYTPSRVAPATFGLMKLALATSYIHLIVPPGRKRISRDKNITVFFFSILTFTTFSTLFFLWYKIFSVA